MVSRAACDPKRVLPCPPHPHPNLATDPLPYLHSNQGDVKSGRIARADVAAIAIESLTSAASFDTTFECYDGDTAKVSKVVTWCRVREQRVIPHYLTHSLTHSLTHVLTYLLTCTAKELNAVMASNAKGVATGSREATSAMSGKERRADSWPTLFEGLQRDRA